MAIWSAGSTLAAASRASRARTKSSKHLNDVPSTSTKGSKVPSPDPPIPIPEGAQPDEIEEINRLNNLNSRKFFDYGLGGLGYRGIDFTPEEEKQDKTYSDIRTKASNDTWRIKTRLQNQFTYAVNPFHEDSISWDFNMPLNRAPLYILKTGMVHNGEKFCIPFTKSITEQMANPEKAYVREANMLISKQNLFEPSETYAKNEKRQASREKQIAEWIKLNQKYFGENYLTDHSERELTPGQYVADFFTAAGKGNVEKLFFNLSPEDQDKWLREMKDIRFKEEMTRSINQYATCVVPYDGKHEYDAINKKYFGELYANYPQQYGLRHHIDATFLVPGTQEFKDGLYQDFRPPTVRQALPRELEAQAQAINESFRNNPNIPLLKNLKHKQEPIKHESKTERRLPDISNIQDIQNETQSEL